MTPKNFRVPGPADRAKVENLGFTSHDAELISRKRSARIKLSEEVIQAIPEFENTNSELKKE